MTSIGFSKGKLLGINIWRAMIEVTVLGAIVGGVGILIGYAFYNASL